MRRVAVEIVHTPSSPALIDGRLPFPSHHGVILVHLLGIARNQFRSGRSSMKYNHAVLVEHVERRNGLLTIFSLN